MRVSKKCSNTKANWKRHDQNWTQVGFSRRQRDDGVQQSPYANLGSDWNTIFKRFAEASLAQPAELIRGLSSVVAATQSNNVTAAMKLAFDFIGACGEDKEEMDDRQSRQAARQNDESEPSEDIKDTDDGTHTLPILRRLKEPARSLDEHLGAKDDEPDWEGLWGKKIYTGGDQPWPIGMIDTQLAEISNDYTADSSVERSDANNLVRALRTVCVTFGILGPPLTLRL
jgi:hypothetical protein